MHFGEAALSWAEVADRLNFNTARGAKSASWRWEQKHPAEAAPLKQARRLTPRLTQSTGVQASEQPLLDEAAIIERARQAHRVTAKLQARRQSQRLEFSHGPVALVEVADVHLGNSGTDYDRAFEEAELIAGTPGMYAIFAGDILDNFIVGRLRQARDDSCFRIDEEWVLARHYLKIIAAKLVVVVSGNHDQWVHLLTGVDYFREVVASIRPTVIYDTDDALVAVRVGDWEVPLRIRHKWRGNSIYNPTHGIERAMKWDKGFLVGMGAHTHVSGVVRSTNVGGVNGMAMLAGAYKRVDTYARTCGFPESNASTAVTVVFDDEDRSLTGFDNLWTAARYMNTMYK